MKKKRNEIILGKLIINTVKSILTVGFKLFNSQIMNLYIKDFEIRGSCLNIKIYQRI